MTKSFFRSQSRIFCLKKSTLILSLGVFMVPFLPFSGIAASQQELTGVKKEIARQQQSLSTQQKNLDQLQSSLKNQEIEIATLEKQIRETKQELVNANQNIARLTDKIAVLSKDEKSQSEKLSQLLKTYYITQGSATGNIWNDNSREDRMSQYYQHLAKARVAALEELENTRRELNESERQLQLEKNQINTLLTQQTSKRDQLAQTQNKRVSWR